MINSLKTKRMFYMLAKLSGTEGRWDVKLPLNGPLFQIRVSYFCLPSPYPYSQKSALILPFLKWEKSHTLRSHSLPPLCSLGFNLIPLCFSEEGKFSIRDAGKFLLGFPLRAIILPHPLPSILLLLQTNLPWFYFPSVSVLTISPKNAFPNHF